MNLKNLCLCILPLIFFSCSSGITENEGNGVTLKKTASTLNKSTKWLTPLEGNIYDESFSRVPGISASLSLSTDLFAVSEKLGTGNKIYPHIDGAFSLDSSRASDVLFDCIDGFSTALENGENGETYFHSSNVYSLVMFLYDYKRLYGDAEFLWHATGEVFVDDKFCQCPVRLFISPGPEKEKRSYTDNHVDVMVYAALKNSSWKLVSVELVSEIQNEEPDDSVSAETATLEE